MLDDDDDDDDKDDDDDDDDDDEVVVVVVVLAAVVAAVVPVISPEGAPRVTASQGLALPWVTLFKLRSFEAESRACQKSKLLTGPFSAGLPRPSEPKPLGCSAAGASHTRSQNIPQPWRQVRGRNATLQLVLCRAKVELYFESTFLN